MKTETFHIGGVTESVFGPIGLAEDFYHVMDCIAEKMEILRIERLPRTGDYYRYVVTSK